MSHCNGHRWSKFWWRDHQGDAALRACSLAARGYWMELLCIAHEATPVGHVLVNGRRPTPRQMAAIAGCSEAQVKRLETELEAAGVFDKLHDGTIVCRRMVRDEEASAVGRANVAKRWKDTEKSENPISPPSSTPIREPSRDPFTRGRVQKEEAEEERKEVDLPSAFVRPARVPAAPNGHAENEAAIDPEPVPTAQRIATQNLLGKVARKLDSPAKTAGTKYPEHSRAEQIAASLKPPTLLELDPRVAAQVLAERRAFMQRAAQQQAMAS